MTRKEKTALPEGFVEFVGEHPDMTRADLARHFGVHYQTVCMALRSARVDKPLQAAGRRSTLPPAGDLLPLVEKHDVKGVAEMFGVSTRAVYRAVRSARIATETEGA